MSTDIRAELANLRDAAERYRAEATALHASLLLHIEGLEAKLTTPKPTGLPPADGHGWWWGAWADGGRAFRLEVSRG